MHSAIYSDIPVGYAPHMTGLGRKIQERREALKLTQTALGDLVGRGQSAVSQWENEESTPDGVLLISIAHALTWTVDDLIEGVNGDYDHWRRDLLGQAGALSSRGLSCNSTSEGTPDAGTVDPSGTLRDLYAELSVASEAFNTLAQTAQHWRDRIAAVVGQQLGHDATRRQAPMAGTGPADDVAPLRSDARSTHRKNTRRRRSG